MKTFPLVYIPIPRHLLKTFIGNENCSFDPSIPLPVELPPESNTEQITTEMILSGLLQTLVKNPADNNSTYYRNLIIALKPAIAFELQEAAIIKAKNEDYETALEIMDLLFGLKGKTPELLLNKALILQDRATAAVLTAAVASTAGEEEIEDAYEEALANPIPDTLFYAALFYEHRNDFSRTISCLESYFEAIHKEELIDYENDKYSKAQELLTWIRSNGLDDNDFMEAAALMRNGEEEKGIIKAKDFLERYPRAGKGWFVLGWGLRCLSRWDSALECFKKALTLGCINADTYNELAICCLETGDLATAEQELKKALQLDPENVKIISNLGILAIKQGNSEKADAFFRTVLTLDPGDPVAAAYLP